MTRDEFLAKEDVHRELVRKKLYVAIGNLAMRAEHHDDSKREEPEISGFMQMAEELDLSKAEYPSDAYRMILKKHSNTTIWPHYEANDHHPEHFADGVNGMSLLSLLEMLADWYAAHQRQKGGSMANSLLYNQKRFGISDQLQEIFENTARELRLFDADPPEEEDDGEGQEQEEE